MKKKLAKRVLVFMLVFVVATSGAIVSPISTQAAPKYSVTMNKTLYTMKKGKKVQLKTKLNKVAKKKKVEWKTSNKKVAVVSQKGKVTAKKNGKATITAKIKGTKVKASCKIVVGTPVKSVELDKKTVILDVGKQFQLKASVSPKKPTNKKLTYKSDKKSVATVSSKGVIKAVNEGKAKITVAAADGSGKSAVCNVTVKKMKNQKEVTSVSISENKLDLEPGQGKKLTASVQPDDAADKTLSWQSSNPAVATVTNDGDVKAVGEGTALITVATVNGKSASCSVKVSYKSAVSNQVELNQALSSKMVMDIVYRSDAASSITIPAGNYSAKTITIHAPNAEVINNGQFAKVTINAIAQNTYIENSNNVIYFNAGQGHLVIGKNGVATINLNSAGNQKLHLENEGHVNSLNLPGKTDLRVGGSEAVPVILDKGAAGTVITTSAELKITASVKWDMIVLPGGEHTKAIVEDESCTPSICGVGCIPVTISVSNDVVNIPAEKKDNLGIDQKVIVSGSVQEYYLEDQTEEETGEDENSQPAKGESKKLAGPQGAGQTAVYLLPYNASNSNLDEINCENILAASQPSAVTDADGNYQIQNVEIGNYWMITKKEGYQTVTKSLMITSTNSEIFSCGATTLLSNEIVGCENAPKISGTIIDTFTGESVNVAGIQVKLRSGVGNIGGNVLKTTVTNEEGRYEFENVPAGVYTVEALDLRQNLSSDVVCYYASHTDIVAAYPYLSTENYNCTVDRRLDEISTGQGLLQFRLTWGTEESGASADIDSHLIGPRADGEGEFHVYYNDEKYYNSDEKLIADLDVDDTDWEGPEHTTLYQEMPGIYRFYVHNFSERDTEDSEMLAKSAVQVRVAVGENHYDFKCPNEKGNLWYVCDYNSMTHTIIPKNEMSTFLLDEEYIGLSEEETNRRYLEREKSSAREKVTSLKRDLNTFNDNAARESYLNRVAAWETRIDAAADIDTVKQVHAEMEGIDSEVYGAYRFPDISADNLDNYADTHVELDEDGNPTGVRLVRNCSTLYGDTLVNFKAGGCYEGQSVITESSNVEGYAYVLHVADDKTGLAYDLFVKVDVDGIAAAILREVEDCNWVIGFFEENESIREDKAQLGNIVENIAQINDQDQYDKVTEWIEEISRKYYRLSASFIIDNVHAERGLTDWKMTVSRNEDENGSWLSSETVLELERSSEVTDGELLAKLNVTFADYDDNGEKVDVTFEVSDSDNENYQKLIKATDGEYTKKIYIKITE